VEWGGTTNFESAYQSLLNEALHYKMPADKMPEYIVVLSDMQFNQATGNNHGFWGHSNIHYPETAFEKMKTRFENSGYKLPKIIFWNLNAQFDNFPTTSTQDNVALVSGFSPFVMKAIVEANLEKISPEANLEKISPEAIMVSTVAKYQKMIEEV
jgi:hypothetical protein